MPSLLKILLNILLTGAGDLVVVELTPKNSTQYMSF